MRQESLVTAVEPELVAGAVAVAGITAWWVAGAEERSKRAKYAEWETKEREYQDERARLAYIEPRNEWAEADLKGFNGEEDPNGPLLMAVKGDVFNVWKGRGFYGPGGEYHIMAGIDATRFLAKNALKEEADDEKEVGLNIAERANLEAWYWIIKNKYEKVGHLSGYDPTATDM